VLFKVVAVLTQQHLSRLLAADKLHPQLHLAAHQLLVASQTLAALQSAKASSPNEELSEPPRIVAINANVMLV